MSNKHMPAFPHPSGAQGCDGLTKREYMATTILAGIMAREPSHYREAHCAERAVEQADALIAALGGE